MRGVWGGGGGGVAGARVATQDYATEVKKKICSWWNREGD